MIKLVRCIGSLFMLNALLLLYVLPFLSKINDGLSDHDDLKNEVDVAAFGVKLPGRDLHASGSRGGILLFTRVMSAGVTFGLLQHLVTTDDYPIHNSDFGYR